MIQRVLDAFVRALGHALLPRVIGMTLLPLLVMTVVALGLGYFFWSGAVEWMRAALASWSVVGWLDGRLQVGWPGGLAALLAPFALVALATPVIVLTSLVLVSTLMTPTLARMVAERRFPALRRQGGASLAASIGWSAGSLLVAVVALIVSLPLWLIPPLVLLLPPLIWGWLTYRVFAFDALATHASKDERRGLIQRHRMSLLIMGVVTGFLGAAPSLLWASGAMFIAMAPLLVPLAIWIYTLVFAFASLWFAHFLLQALERERALAGVSEVPTTASAPVAAPASEVIDVQARPVSAPPALPDAPISPLS